jgi:hypothetical protein
MSATSRRASQTRSSPASNRYIRGEDVSAAVTGVDRSDVDADANEVDTATSAQTGVERGRCSMRSADMMPWTGQPKNLMTRHAVRIEA